MKNRFKLSIMLLAALSLTSTSALADWDIVQWLIDFSRTKGVQPVKDETYQNECSDCHFAYQPGLLPVKSWEALLTNEALKDHFGVNAELDEDTLKEVRNYALANAAENSYYKLSRKVANATSEGQSPLRITELRFVARKHQEIPEKMIKGNSRVKSLSFCDKCHTEAAQGVYEPDTVNIPGYPDWDDED